MLHAFSTNRVKLAAREPKATDNLGQRQYLFAKRQDLVQAPDEHNPYHTAPFATYAAI